MPNDCLGEASFNGGGEFQRSLTLQVGQDGRDSGQGVWRGFYAGWGRRDARCWTGVKECRADLPAASDTRSDLLNNGNGSLNDRGGEVIKLRVMYLSALLSPGNSGPLVGRKVRTTRVAPRLTISIPPTGEIPTVGIRMTRSLDSSPLPPPDVSVEESSDLSEADKNSLMDESDDSGIIPGSHSESELRMDEDVDSLQKSQR